ncbi:twin-arginine translocase subunit TatB [Altericroceibacterium spongiae]|uniref:Sec-independent protein translocase protein TatB n=1 Tax=Altericroceibacterium spongiae TaxID=2320269 RepID=A0A420EKL5_9SPHN|nr:Sec-independent protein translocase protein TatB [Altericroceibacterium spongiae]RKF21136.1 twin-arginine translocase subunit TatB [Altericroceibacterium spongiae]
MLDLGASELLMIVVVAVIVIGPKDMPLALRTAGRWIGKFRRVSSHFRTGLDAMVREAEMEEMEKKWREQNAKIMAENPSPPLNEEDADALPAPSESAGGEGDLKVTETDDVAADSASAESRKAGAERPATGAESETKASDISGTSADEPSASADRATRNS